MNIFSKLIYSFIIIFLTCPQVQGQFRTGFNKGYLVNFKGDTTTPYDEDHQN